MVKMILKNELQIKPNLKKLLFLKTLDEVLNTKRIRAKRDLVADRGFSPNNKGPGIHGGNALKANRKVHLRKSQKI